jgi:hypothetical protein
MNASVAKKPPVASILTRVEQFSLWDACATESGFVNHTAVTVPNQFVYGVFQGPPLPLADVAPAQRRRGLACAFC